MTYATKSIFKWLLADFVKVSNTHASEHGQLYGEADVNRCMDSIETISFHETKNIDGVKFTPYHAGHVLGACMFMIEIAGVKILYTGDYSREEDRHLMPAEIPPSKPDVVITESTYGTNNHEPREAREARFTHTVHKIVDRGGRCLIPMFALGRAQELLLILDEYWSRDSELQKIPVYYASNLARKCMKQYQQSVNDMNESIRNRPNPFKFQHISYLKSINQFDDSGPSVVLATPGMLQNGLSRDLFEAWCQDSKNGLIIAGYTVEGTLGKEVMNEPDTIKTMTGQTVPRRMEVSTISFAAHVDYEQNRDFVRELAPPYVILVHGEVNEMARFKQEFESEYEADPLYNFQVYNPANIEKVELYFRGDKMAKVIGKIATGGTPRRGVKVSGVLIKRSFDYHICAPSELTENFQLETSVLTQRQRIAFPYTFGFLRHFVELMHGDSVVHTKNDGNDVLTVLNKVVVTHDAAADAVTLEWEANAENDMWADSVLATILQIDQSPEVIRISQSDTCNNKAHDHAPDAGHKHDSVKFVESPVELSESKFGDQLCKHLGRIFGSCSANEAGTTLTVEVDSKSAEIALPGLTVKSEDAAWAQHLTVVSRRFRMTVKPEFR